MSVINKINVGGQEYDLNVATVAKTISYDNTSSGLTAANVQTAIDEVTDKINTIDLDAITALNSNLIYKTHRWLRFNPSNRKGLIIKANTIIRLANGKLKAFMTDTAVDLSSYITTAGADYFVFIDNDGNITAQTSNTKENAVKIGRFHTLCVVAGTITMIAPAAPSSGLAVGGNYLVKSYNKDTDADFYNFYNKAITAVTVQSAYDVITMTHPLSGFDAGDILPESVFCLSWHPDCLVEDAMVYDQDTKIACDVYLQSGKGFETRSKYGATHTVSRTPYNHAEDFRMIGKKLLADYQFTSCALGGNEKTAISGAKDWTTVGGHVDTAGRRMISAIGVEEMTGYLYQWLDEVSPSGGSSWVTTDTHASFGQEYGAPYVLFAGGYWSGSSYCGSRCRSSAGVRSGVGATCGGRGSSRIVTD